VLHAEYAGGGPGYLLVRVTGRAHAPAPAKLTPPALLIHDRTAWRRLATVVGTDFIDAGPDQPAFQVDVEVPLHLADAAGPWWLEPGLPVAVAAPLAPDVDALRARVRELAGEVAALRERATTTPADAPVEAPPKITAARVPRPRPRLRALRPTLPALLVATGALATADAVATVVWQEPVTALWAARQQHELAAGVARLDTKLVRQTPQAALQPTIDPPTRMRALARTLERTTDQGHPVGRLAIPRIGARDVVVQGTGASSLRKGPGHYLGTALPGQPGTVGIAGHRTTYGAPFRHLDALRRGDAITITMPYGEFVYRVEGTRIVSPDDVSSLTNIGRQRLVLTACHPLYSAAQRIVVIARLDRSKPRGAAATSTQPATPPAAPAAVPAAPGPRA